MSRDARHRPAQHGMEAQPSNGWLGIGALCAAAVGVVVVIGFNWVWLGISCSALALGTQAYRGAKRQTKVGARRIWIAAGALVAGVIGAVLVVVDRIWLSLPIAAVGLGIDAFVHARQRANGSICWDLLIPATVALVIGGIALNMFFDDAATQFEEWTKQFDAREVEPPPVFARPMVLPDHSRRGHLSVGSCIMRPAPEQDARVHPVPCDSPTAYGRVMRMARPTSSAPTCPDRTDIVIGSLARPTACVVVLPRNSMPQKRARQPALASDGSSSVRVLDQAPQPRRQCHSYAGRGGRRCVEYCQRDVRVRGLGRPA
jgi:hypothetical protein